MSIKISFGTLKGKKLLKLSTNNYGINHKEIKPTPSMAKSVLFNILNNSPIFSKKITTCDVLDLCAGTGSVGFEFLSCGASKVTFLEKSKHAICNIKKNALKLNCIDRVKTLNYSIPKPIPANMYDIVFFDAPYDMRALVHTQFDILIRKKTIKNEGLLIMEVDKSFDFCGTHKNFESIAAENFSAYQERQVNSKTKLIFFKIK